MTEISLSSSRPLPPVEQELSDSEEDAATSFDRDLRSGPTGGLHIRTKPGQTDVGKTSDTQGSELALVATTPNSLAMTQPQDELDFLLEELGRIEDQQGKLRDAVKHNKGIVVHPRQEVLDASESDSDFDTPKAPTPKKKLLVSGGLTGFGVAHDLLQIDFSPIEEAPEEFKAVAFYEEPREIKPGLSGSFGFCDPASKEMHKYLERLEEQQRHVLEMISGKKQELLMSYATKGRVGGSKPAQAIKGGAGKSRLARNTTADKAVIADAMGMSIPGKSALAKAGSIVGSLRGKGAIADGLGLSGKGVLAAKLPIVANATSFAVVAKVGSTAMTPSTAPKATPKAQEAGMPKHKELRPMRTGPEPKRTAAVQKEEMARKELEELKEQIGVPLPGSTPSTAHLAGKKGQAARRSPVAKPSPSTLPDRVAEASSAKADSPAPAAERALSNSPQTKFTNKFAKRGGGRVSTLGAEEEETAAGGGAEGGEKKSGFFGGLKKIISSKKSTAT